MQRIGKVSLQSKLSIYIIKTFNSQKEFFVFINMILMYS